MAELWEAVPGTLAGMLPSIADCAMVPRRLGWAGLGWGGMHGSQLVLCLPCSVLWGPRVGNPCPPQAGAWDCCFAVRQAKEPVRRAQGARVEPGQPRAPPAACEQCVVRQANQSNTSAGWLLAMVHLSSFAFSGQLASSDDGGGFTTPTTSASAK